MMVRQTGKFTFKKPYKFTGGGTDLYVQIPEKIKDYNLVFLEDPEMYKIVEDESKISFGGSVTFEDLKKSAELKKYIPDLENIFDLMASLHIRNSATLAGNYSKCFPNWRFEHLLFSPQCRYLFKKRRKPEKSFS